MSVGMLFAFKGGPGLGFTFIMWKVHSLRVFLRCVLEFLEILKKIIFQLKYCRSCLVKFEILRASFTGILSYVIVPVGLCPWQRGCDFLLSLRKLSKIKILLKIENVPLSSCKWERNDLWIRKKFSLEVLSSKILAKARLGSGMVMKRV